MKAVNLIPADAARASSRSATGAAPFALIGVLAAALAMVAVWTLTERSVESKQRELAAITVEDTRTGDRSRHDAKALFVFIGASPHTEWLGGQLATDRAGFLLTGRDVQGDDLAEYEDERPLFLETSRPGIFAVGDVHSGSIKRVASAVGEGSMAVRLVHQRLAAPVHPAR